MEIENSNKKKEKTAPPKFLSQRKKKMMAAIEKKRNKNAKKKNEKHKMVSESVYFSNFEEKVEKAKFKHNKDLELYLIQILKEENVVFLSFKTYFCLKY